MPEEPTKPKSSVIKILLLVLITIIVLVGLYQWAVHQGDKSKQRFMQKLELGDLMNAEAAKPEPPPAKAPDISIHNAVIEGDIQAVKQHLADGADVSAKDYRGSTSLHSAAKKGHKEIAELLITKGADVNATYGGGRTPLHQAAWKGHKEIAELLISNGADVNAKDDVGDTPVDWAILDKQPETADLLRKHGGKTGDWLNADKSIHNAVIAGHIKAVKQHLAAGADVNAKTESGWTPLHEAARSGRKEIAELLIDKGAEVNATNGDTPLDVAIDYEKTEIADLLRKHGAKSGVEYSISKAAFKGNIEAVKQHIDAGVDVNVKNDVEMTPLHFAASFGHKEIVELLIPNVADLNAKNVLGETPLDLANRFKHTKTADLLRKHGVKTREELKAEGK